jgi:exodeoxyribonuclease VII small subunit
MTSMPRRKPSPEESPAQPSFEESLAKLEAIIEAMEHEQLPLEELVNYYEQGSGLLGHCESILQTARDRIELITLRSSSETKPQENRPGTASEPPPTSIMADHSDHDDVDFDDAPGASDDDPDDIRLF